MPRTMEVVDKPLVPANDRLAAAQRLIDNYRGAAGGGKTRQRAIEIASGEMRHSVAAVTGRMSSRSGNLTPAAVHEAWRRGVAAHESMDYEIRTLAAENEIRRDEVRRWTAVDFSELERRITVTWLGMNELVVNEPLVDAPSRDDLHRLPNVSLGSLEGPRAELAVEAESLLGYRPLREAVKAPGALRLALVRTGIEALDQASVDAYKAQMVEHYRTHKKMSAPTWRLTRLDQYKQPVPEFVLRKACQIKKELPSAVFYIDQLAVDPFLVVSVGPLQDYITNQPSRALDPETQAYVEVWDEPKFEEGL